MHDGGREDKLRGHVLLGPTTLLPLLGCVSSPVQAGYGTRMSDDVRTPAAMSGYVDGGEHESRMYHVTVTGVCDDVFPNQKHSHVSSGMAVRATRRDRRL